jgi:hypothetical protein
MVRAEAVAAPGFCRPPGAYASDQSVTISTATPEASIRYTIDGTIPSETEGTLYTGAVAVSATTTIRAIAYKNTDCRCTPEKDFEACR